jgi:hypothetical protein
VQEDDDKEMVVVVVVMHVHFGNITNTSWVCIKYV